MDSRLSKIKLFLMDMDGTVYIGTNEIKGSFDALRFIQSKNKNFCFLTNNSSKIGEEYVKKLANMNFNINKNEIFTSGDATIEYLNTYYPKKNVYLVGVPSLCEDFINKGINLVDDNPDIVVLSFDMTLTYEKLVKATRFIAQGATYIATHPDMVCPATPVDLPDIGSFIKLIDGATGKKPSIICGKPYTAMADSVMHKFGLKSDEIAMVGDRLYTDIMFAVNNDFLPILVLSGETDKKMLDEFEYKDKCLVLDSFADIKPLLN